MWLTAEKLVRHNIGAIIQCHRRFPDEPPASVSRDRCRWRELRAMSNSFELAVFTSSLTRQSHCRAAQELQIIASGLLGEWADFDYIGSGNDWLSEAQKREIEHFKFYQRFAYSGNRSPLRWPHKKTPAGGSSGAPTPCLEREAGRVAQACPGAFVTYECALSPRPKINLTIGRYRPISA